MLFWQVKQIECEILFFIFTVLVIFINLRVERYQHSSRTSTANSIQYSELCGKSDKNVGCLQAKGDSPLFPQLAKY